MRILLASSELFPFSKTGGLADMVGALARALAQAGHEARAVTPLYRGIREKFPAIKRENWEFHIPLGAEWYHGSLWSLEPEPGLKIYFIEQAEFFDRAGIYLEKNLSYPDNDARYIFFSKCVVHLARWLPWGPDMVHVHDWQVALVPALMQQQKREGWGNPPPTCLTIHNLAYQGLFPGKSFDLTNLSLDFFTPEAAEYFGMLNCLKAGIALADVITTVSPRYAREIMTEEFGCSLDGLLRKRQASLYGILNGVDYQEWNTAKNPHLFAPYSVTRMAGKKANKAELQRMVALPVDDKIPLFGNISRLAEQKGVDIQLGALAEMLNSNIQFVQLGSGSPEFEEGYRELAARFPHKVAVRFGYNEKLSHRIEAGCDFFLMPSRFEPCGLNQMYSLRYGTIPIVRATGGLDDSVTDYSESTTTANGVKFYDYTPLALSKAIRKALAVYKEPALMRKFQRNAMRVDYSWEKTVNEYISVYSKILK
ncbi:MAG TPA: glycogen synthase GlgA [Candidatus Sulfotelmatobacter sp.]|jgi:starch synthase|nr:glycogen synthase GlgA [Candidatus Sulfotelmatobacter sp.]